ncbi:MAG TPA: EthD domain-containing protein [Rhizomicrobium sp.]|jgi:uncharacterized protein (TIGR02118 family)
MAVALTRLPALTRTEFQRHWSDVHAPLVGSLAEVLGIRKYLQLHSFPDEATAGIAASGGAPAPYDGLAEIWYDSLDTLAERMKNADARAAARRLRDDEANFIDREKTRAWWSTEHAVL